jgi:putative oxidoreductase
MATQSGTGSPRPAGALGKLRALEERLASALAPYVLLLVRFIFGYGLLRAGLGKLQNLEAIEQFFAGLGIPAPGINAAVVGGFELVGGALLMLGLFTRATAGVLTVVLLVAVATAHGGEVGQFFKDPGVAIAAAPVAFLAALMALGVAGPGRFSLDTLISGRPGR